LKALAKSWSGVVILRDKRDWYYVICPMEYREQGIPLRKYVFGPFRDYDMALSESDKVGGWEIIPLPTNDLEEAVGILEQE